MNGATEFMGIEDFCKRRAIARVDLVERHGVAYDPLDAPHGFALAVDEVVDDYHVIVVRYQLDGRVRADEAGSVGDENGAERGRRLQSR